MSNLKKLIMMANQIDGKPSLPKEYVQLEYLESTGTQYIDVPVEWKDINSITVTCQAAGNIAVTNQAVLGSKIGVFATQCWGVYVNGAKKEWQWSTGIDPYLKITANLFTTIENNAVSGAYGYIIIADTQELKNTSYSGFVPKNNLQLFATQNTSRQFLGKIFHIAINTNVIELIPALRIADSKPGMYDLVSGQFFTNQGTGEFAYHIADKPVPYLAFEALEDDLQVSITKSATQYSLDRVNWIDLPAEELTEPISKGEKVWFRANITPTTTGIGTFSCTKKCNLEGTPMSLLYGDRAGDYARIPNYAFMALFNNNIKIISATDDFITFSSIGASTCQDMFKQCSNFVSSLPNFFTTYDSCYNSMYYGTKIEEIILPAKKSASGCYRNIATYCYSLKKAIICIEDLTITCLFGAFMNCSKLNHITLLILPPPNSVNNSMAAWVSGVSSTGTIVLNKNIEWNPEDYRGVNGIPAGWEVKYCDPDNLDDIRDYREIDQSW